MEKVIEKLRGMACSFEAVYKMQKAVQLLYLLSEKEHAYKFLIEDIAADLEDAYVDLRVLLEEFEKADEDE